MADKEVKLVLTAEDNISSVIKKVSEHLSENTGLGQTITALSTSFLAVTKAVEIAANAISKISGPMIEGTKMAAEADVVNKRLAMSLAAVGEYSDKAFKDITDWAGALESATGISDEAFKSLVALGTQQGMSAEQSKKAAEAALNLAAATGQDMNTAFQQMSVTMTGTAGKLGKMIPELRNLTKEELENGAAIDIIAKKYDGFAANSANSFDGAMKRANAQIDNVKEAFGRLIAQNPAVIAAIDSVASIIGSAAAAADELSTWILNNQEDIKILATSFGIAAVAVGTYAAIMNASTIATIAGKVAMIAFNTVMMAAPFGWAILAVGALTAGLYLLYKNFDLVAGAVKVGLGYALQAVTMQLQMFLSGLSKVVGFFNADWAKSIDDMNAKISSVSQSLIDSGKAQMEAARQAKKGAEDQSTAQMQAARATEGLTNKITEQEQALIKLKNEYEKAAEKAQTSFNALKDLMPRMNLENFKRDAQNWQNSIQDLKQKAENLRANIQVGVDGDAVKAELDKINQQIRFAEEATKAIKLKSAIESREAILKEEQIRLNQQRMSTIAVETEISMMRMSQARNLRDNLIEVETQRLLKQRGLASVEQQAGINTQQAAMMAANDIELSAFRSHLEAKRALSRDMVTQKTLVERDIEMAMFKENLDNQKKLAVDIELQKQAALAQVRADAMVSGSQGAIQAKNDVEVLQAQAKQQELARLRSEDMISEQQYQEQLTALKIQQIQARTEMEVMMNQERMTLLGTSPEALNLALENERMHAEQQMLILQEKLAAQQLTEDEFRLMKEQSEMASLERQSQIKEQHLQREVEQNQRLNKNWEVTLAKMRLEQERHGMLMGTIRGIQQSQEYAAIQDGLSNISSLRSSGDRKAFEAGKAAAIAQTTINTFMSATSAYAALASIPIIGPALGIAAAAAAVAAGMNNVAQIKSQKFQSGGQAHSGLDEVPRSMNNSSFILKAGERVVQPGQNKELGEAIDKINNNESGGGHNININIHGNATKNAIEEMKDALIEVLRDSSERGMPIIHEKGIVRG
jgi:hypothetical protein